MKEILILTKLFRANGNRENAYYMEKYMRNQFPFLGIKTPLRRELMKQFFEETSLLKQPYNEEFVEEVWALPEREFQAAALDYMEKSLKKLEKRHLPGLEKLITTKSWWDTVDVLGPKAVGKIAADHPEVIKETIDNWAYGDDLWLRRAAILFQLKYKKNTNEELLYRYCRENADSKEFFIQKGIGWALREYSKTNPSSVKNFIERSSLSKLSIREGSKYI